MKKVLSFILMFVILAQVSVFGESGSAVSDYVYKSTPAPEISYVGGEWAVIGLARGSEEIPEEYFDGYRQRAAKKIKELDGVLSDTRYTEYSRVILALCAIGSDPENFFGYNLAKPLEDVEKTMNQGINGAIWALIALDNINGAQEAKKAYLDAVLDAQNDDGGWAFSKDSDSDIDLTAMALCALSRHKDEAGKSIDKALSYISGMQEADGGFTSWGSRSSESVSQVITALCSLGIAEDDERFVKDNTLSENLMTYQNADGSFKHSKSESGANQMATEQALCALSALWRKSQNKTAIYDMSDVQKKDNSQNTSYGLPGKDSAVIKKEAVIEKTFDDIKDNAARSRIEALAARKIISGKSETSFDADALMTRAEFATIVVNGLGLGGNGEKIFDDVKEDDWYFDTVAAAYRYKIVSGVSESEFNPGGFITKEEAAAMISRAGALCGLNTQYSEDGIRDILAGFSDYRSAADWARGALAFCAENNIIDQSETELAPKEQVTRAQIAVMLYNLLDAAQLL